MTSTTDKVELLPCPWGCLSETLWTQARAAYDMLVKCRDHTDWIELSEWNTRAQHVQSCEWCEKGIPINSDGYLHDFTSELPLDQTHMYRRCQRMPKGKPPYDEKPTGEERIAVIGEGNRLEPTSAPFQSVDARAVAEEIAKRYASYYWDREKMVENCAAIITKHVHPASLTDAIEAVTRLRDKHGVSNNQDYEYGFYDAIQEIITTLQSLQGKAPVGEPCSHCDGIGSVRFTGPVMVGCKYCNETGRTVATTPSSGEE